MGSSSCYRPLYGEGMMKNLVLFLVLCVVPSIVLGGGNGRGDPHHDHEGMGDTYITNEYITNEYITNEYITIDETVIYNAIRKAEIDGHLASNRAAASHQFDWGTDKLQLSVAMARVGGAGGISFAIGKRFGKDYPLLSANVAMDDSAKKISYAIALHWRI
jgi:hypothetical protein